MGGNGSGGRNRKPALIKKLEGHRGHRRIPDEPVASGAPRCPDYFTVDQRQLWDATLRPAPPGLLSACDTALLEVFVCT